jgi:AhpD family alkylhydroperoxidase
MTAHVKEFFERFGAYTQLIKQHTPNAASGFSALFGKVMAEGALSVKDKELIALGIGLALRCEPCIRLHVKKSLEAGATKQQVLEAAQVAVMMGGGPVYTHLPMVIETIEALQS